MTDIVSSMALASRFINCTGRHLFLTGRAGTGKTTFLRALVAQTHKKVVVAAPTGIAAINAGGVTLHSLFHLPFGCFLPSDSGLDQLELNTQVNTPRSIVRNIKMHDTKRAMIRQMELLIIDEVSMLRADLLDAIDTVLRNIRRNRHVAFGGVQVLFIGDMLQLPPVVKQEEWQLLRHHYHGMYFFQAMVLRDQPPLYLELKKVYRQSDPRFIELLNRIRHDKPSHDDIELLNNHVDSHYDPVHSEGGVFITTHNRNADDINQRAIARIKEPAFAFEADISGDFNESQYPIEKVLRLKVGARVMFIKNDLSGEQRYFNGKIGTVQELDDDQIVVRFDDNTPDTLVEQYIWENKKYSLKKETNEIEEKVTGTFAQYPLRLAWAITVHKSQGLTFDKAVIDVSAAFARGQVYVALSRLTGLSGLTLTAPLPMNQPGVDIALRRFSQSQSTQDTLKQELKNASLQYLHNQLINTFNFGYLVDTCRTFVASFNKEEGRSAKQRQHDWAKQFYDDLLPIARVGERFVRQLRAIPGFSSWDGDVDHRRGGIQTGMAFEEGGWAGQRTETHHGGMQTGMGFDEERQQEFSANNVSHEQGVPVIAAVHDRVKAAVSYFVPLLKEMSQTIFSHITDIDGLVGVKGYKAELRTLEAAFFGFVQRMQKMEAMLLAAIRDDEPTRSSLANPDMERERSRMLKSEEKKGRRGGKRGRGREGERGRGREGKRERGREGERGRGRDGEMEGGREGKRERGKKGLDGGAARLGNHDSEERKLPSAEVSLELFRQGNAIDEIATIRSLAISTVSGHLASCVARGLIGVEHFLDKQKRQQILLAAEAVKSRKLSDIMAVLGDEFTYADIHFALAGDATDASE